MNLYLRSDAGYNNESQARSRAGGHLYLGNKHPKPNVNNGAILNPTHILRHVASSAADAEIRATFVNCREAIPLRTTLNEMGYQQPLTQVTLDNTTAVGFVNRKIKQRRTKAIDMQYYWLQDEDTQENAGFLWKPSDKNVANYFTKHLPPTHHRNIRHHYVYHTANGYIPLRGCANPMGLLQCFSASATVSDPRASLHQRACRSQRPFEHYDHKTLSLANKLII